MPGCARNQQDLDLTQIEAAKGNQMNCPICTGARKGCEICDAGTVNLERVAEQLFTEEASIWVAETRTPMPVKSWTDHRRHWLTEATGYVETLRQIRKTA